MERKFLIVDDDARIHMLLIKYLSDFAQCDTAIGGKEAIDMFSESLSSGDHYDAVFMDIFMPGMDGHEVVSRLRELEEEAGVKGPEEFKLVMITTAKDVKNVTKAFFRGFASCYLLKPFKKDEIIRELRENRVLPPEEE